ncbi:hypothetical protein BDAP_001710 [Binucleata daphniae]
MHNRFPKIELPTFEQHYGKLNKEANPLQSAITHNLKNSANKNITTKNSVNASFEVPKNHWFDFDKIHKIESLMFGNNINYKNDRNVIISMYRNKKNKICVKDVINHVKSDVMFVMKMFSFLEMHLLINTTTNNEEERNEDKERYNIKDIGDTKDKSNIINNDDAMSHTLCCNCTNTENLYVNTKEYFFTCFECIKKGKYDEKYTTGDFIEYKNEYNQNIWTKKDELLLIEMIEEEKEWKDIAEVLNKDKEVCILHFLRMSIKTATLKESIHNKKNVLEDCKHTMDTNNNKNDNNDLLNSENICEKKCTINDKHAIDTNKIVVPSYFVFNNLPNPIIGFISFLVSNLHPRIGAEIAKYFLNNLECENVVNESILEHSVLCAKKQKEVETKKEERLWNVLIELQLNKIEHKLVEFEDIMKSNAKEKKQYEVVKDNYIKEFEEFKRRYT